MTKASAPGTSRLRITFPLTRETGGEGSFGELTDQAMLQDQLILNRN